MLQIFFFNIYKVIIEILYLISKFLEESNNNNNKNMKRERMLSNRNYERRILV
jgi:hypothetical protein